MMTRVRATMMMRVRATMMMRVRATMMTHVRAMRIELPPKAPKRLFLPILNRRITA